MITQHLLQRYFDGHCSPEERRQVINWLQDDSADHAALLFIMQDDWQKIDISEDDEELKEKLLHDLRKQLYPVDQPQETKVLLLKPSHRRLIYAAAASVAAILLIGAWLWKDNDYRKPTATMAVLNLWDTIANTSESKKYIVLPDSTQIWLTPGSSISYSINNTNTERIVHIEGQAFFDVAHDSTRPFLVNSGNIQTRVLGTAFNIESYPFEDEVRVSLVRGRVAINKLLTGNKGISIGELRAGEMLTYVKADSSSQKAKLKMTGIPDWTSRRIVFNDVSVGDALQRLAAQYHLTVKVEKDMKLNKRFSTVFDRETPEQMIRNVLFITDYSYRLQGKELTITR